MKPTFAYQDAMTCAEYAQAKAHAHYVVVGKCDGIDAIRHHAQRAAVWLDIADRYVEIARNIRRRYHQTAM
jgi:hypothetical protein